MDNMDDQLCGSISFKPSENSTVSGEGKGVSSKRFHGGYAARDTGRIDSGWDIHARDVGIVQGDPVLMARLEDLEFKLAQVTQLLIGL